MINVSYGQVMSQKLLLDGFKWVDQTSQFSEDLMKSCNKITNVQYFQKLHDLQNDLPFLRETIKVEKAKDAVA